MGNNNLPETKLHKSKESQTLTGDKINTERHETCTTTKKEIGNQDHVNPDPH